MKAYPDSKCVWGYACVCDDCVRRNLTPRHIDITKSIKNPPALGKRQPCEVCGIKYPLKQGDN